MLVKWLVQFLAIDSSRLHSLLIKNTRWTLDDPPVDKLRRLQTLSIKPKPQGGCCAFLSQKPKVASGGIRVDLKKILAQKPSSPESRMDLIALARSMFFEFGQWACEISVPADFEVFLEATKVIKVNPVLVAYMAFTGSLPQKFLELVREYNELYSPASAGAVLNRVLGVAKKSVQPVGTSGQPIVATSQRGDAPNLPTGENIQPEATKANPPQKGLRLRAPQIQRAFDLLCQSLSGPDAVPA